MHRKDHIHDLNETIITDNIVLSISTCIYINNKSNLNIDCYVWYEILLRLRISH